MKYKIEGRQLYLLDEKYWILSGELNKYNLEQLNQTINDMENVFKGKYPSSSFFGDVVFAVEYDKSLARIEYYSDYVGEESTLEIYYMLKNYRDAMIKYNEIQS